SNMKRLGALFVASALTAALAAPLNAQSSDISGEWELTREGGPGGGGQREGRRGGGGGPAKMVIEQDGDTFTGTLELPFGEAKIQEGTIDGNEITFVVQIETPRGNFEMQYTGKVEGDSMAGTWTGGRGDGGEFTREWTAKRVET
ncbi:MAG: hypothetical protein IH966_07545, partial [Gemmatimonadetes bacterium]|nr:hypothetical protein [Gemmatimonadota bacterium]